MSDERTRTPEDPGVSNRIVGIAVTVMFSLVAVGAGTAWLLYPSAHEEPVPDVNPFPLPGLEIHPVASYAAYIAVERARLAGAEGRVPIEEAMALVAAKGPEAYGPLVAPPAPPEALPSIAPLVPPSGPASAYPSSEEVRP